jgi:hypothetical protein
MAQFSATNIPLISYFLEQRRNYLKQCELQIHTPYHIFHLEGYLLDDALHVTHHITLARKGHYPRKAIERSRI